MSICISYFFKMTTVKIMVLISSYCCAYIGDTLVRYQNDGMTLFIITLILLKDLARYKLGMPFSLII